MSEIGIAKAGLLGMAESNVRGENVNQTQSGGLNSQSLRFCNGMGGLLSSASSNVTAKNISQSQSGALNSQSTNLGNAE